MLTIAFCGVTNMPSRTPSMVMTPPCGEVTGTVFWVSPRCSIRCMVASVTPNSRSRLRAFSTRALLVALPSRSCAMRKSTCADRISGE
jgi:hypothetical protein